MVSVSCFGVRVSVMFQFHFMFVHYTFSSVWVTKSIENKLLTVRAAISQRVATQQPKLS